MPIFTHYDVTCDNCGRSGFNGLRFKCLRCVDFDLCQQCHDYDSTCTGTHDSDHPFQTLLDGPAQALFFTGEQLTGRSADSFTCPICGDMGHDDEELLAHVMWMHRDNRDPVICPICVAQPYTHPDRTVDIASHLLQAHGTEVRFLAGLVPFNHGEQLPVNRTTIGTDSQGPAQPTNDGSEEFDQEVMDALYNSLETASSETSIANGNDSVLLPEFDLVSNGQSNSDGRRNPIARGLDNNANH